jgi:NADH dehydrogenase FAD-containing subunit
MMEEIASDIDPISRNDLLKRLAENNVLVRTGHCVQHIKQGVIACRVTAGETRDKVDLIVVAAGARKPAPLLKELDDAENQFAVYVIGDCFKPGRFVDASRQAYMTALKIRSSKILQDQ